MGHAFRRPQSAAKRQDELLPSAENLVPVQRLAVDRQPTGSCLAGEQFVLARKQPEVEGVAVFARDIEVCQKPS